MKLKLKKRSTESKNEQYFDGLINIIDFLEDDTEQNIKEIVLFVMWKLERLILKKHSGETKKTLAVKILKCLFHDDENLTSVFIETHMRDLKQIKTFKRLAIKTWRYFVKNE